MRSVAFSDEVVIRLTTMEEHTAMDLESMFFVLVNRISNRESMDLEEENFGGVVIVCLNYSSCDLMC